MFTKCPNPVCPGRQWQLLSHFVSRGAMDIDGLGEKQVGVLLDRGLVHDAADLYELTRGAAARTRRLRGGLGRPPDRRDRRLARTAVRAGPVRDRDRGGGGGHWRAISQRSSATSTALLAATPRRSRRRRASGRRWRSRSRPARGTGDARADRAPAQCRTALRTRRDRRRARGRSRGRRSCSPARCRPDARSGERTDHRRGRARVELGLEEDRLPARRRERRDRSLRRRSASASR